jgi:hypothetical protein
MEKLYRDAKRKYKKFKGTPSQRRLTLARRVRMIAIFVSAVVSCILFQVHLYDVFDMLLPYQNEFRFIQFCFLFIVTICIEAFIAIIICTVLRLLDMVLWKLEMILWENDHRQRCDYKKIVQQIQSYGIWIEQCDQVRVFTDPDGCRYHKEDDELIVSGSAGGYDKDIRINFRYHHSDAFHGDFYNNDPAKLQETVCKPDLIDLTVFDGEIAEMTKEIQEIPWDG